MITLNIHDEDGNVIRIAEAQKVDITFGVVIDLMELLNINETESNWDILKKITNAWGEIRKLLEKIFPDVSKEEWKNIAVKELLSATIEIIQMTLTELMTLQTKKNLRGE